MALTSNSNFHTDDCHLLQGSHAFHDMTIFQRMSRSLCAVFMGSSLIIMWLLHCSCISILSMMRWQPWCNFIFLMRIIWQLATEILTSSAVVSYNRNAQLSALSHTALITHLQSVHCMSFQRIYHFSLTCDMPFKHLESGHCSFVIHHPEHLQNFNHFFFL